MNRLLFFLTVALLPVAKASAQDTLSLPADSPRWALQGQASVADYLGRRSIMLNGGAAVVDDLEMGDGVIDVDIATPAARGFFGIQFRIDSAGNNAEWVYLRQHKSGAPDAIQYTPVLNTGLNWQLYNGPGFTGPVEIPRDTWFHLRLVLAGAQGALYLNDTTTPILVMDDLKSGQRRGQVALAVLTGATYFSNFQVRTAADAKWERHLPAMPAGTLTRWSISPSFDALARNLERPLAAAERNAMQWQEVEAEAPGLVAINRYRESPHPRVTFQGDFSRRLDPQPGMQVVYARTTINVDRAGTRRLLLGYSDDVSVFLNGTLLYRGRSAQGFRDPGFLGIMNPENDVLYLPLKAGSNELMLAVAELGGGWGFIARLEDVAP